MFILKGIILILTFLLTAYLGLALANTYKQRVKDLRNIRNALNILETKIKYTYKPLPQIFLEISDDFDGEISKIFKIAMEKMKEVSAGEAWSYAIENSNTSMNKDDLNIIKNLEKMLGKTNIEGQISEIKLNCEFIDTQIKKAEEEQRKNEKLYKNLGIIVGLAIVIILI